MATGCQQCKTSKPPSDQDSRWLESIKISVPETTWHAVGCDQCRQVGYNGQTGVFEIWKLDESDLQAISNHTDETQLRKSLFERGHRAILDDGINMVSNGETTFSELRKLGRMLFRSTDSYWFGGVFVE